MAEGGMEGTGAAFWCRRAACVLCAVAWAVFQAGSGQRGSRRRANRQKQQADMQAGAILRTETNRRAEERGGCSDGLWRCRKLKASGMGGRKRMGGPLQREQTGRGLVGEAGAAAVDGRDGGEVGPAMLERSG